MNEAREGISFPDRFKELVWEAPDRIAVMLGEASLTRRELDVRSDRIAHALIGRGFRPGELLTIALPNSLEFVEAMFGCWKAGVTPQPVSYRLPQTELDTIVRLAESRIVIGEASLACAVPVVQIGNLVSEGASTQPLEPIIAPSWKAPTSGGSTGRPKLILSTAPALYTGSFAALWRVTGADTVLMPAPLYHNAPFFIVSAAILSGAPVLLMPRFDAEIALQEIQSRRVTWVYLVPTMMSRIWRLPARTRASYDVSSLRYVWHLAAPCPPWLKRAWIDWLGAGRIYELYGATEGQAVTFITGQEWLRKPGSVGRVLRGEMKVLGPDGVELPPGEIGDIYERQPAGSPIAYEYRGAERQHRDDGWGSVGDIGYIDEDGYVFLADRRSDLILVGGANVYPAEVEAAIEEFHDVQSCCVVGLPDDDLGERVHAIVQPLAGLDLDGLKTHLDQRLARFKQPRTYEIVSYSLRDEAGKVRRSQLRQERLNRLPLRR